MNPAPQIMNVCLAASHDCAVRMIENAGYIERHLPGLRMPDPLRAEIRALCTHRIECPQDLIRREMHIREILASGPESSATAGQIRHMHRMISNLHCTMWYDTYGTGISRFSPRTP